MMRTFIFLALVWVAAPTRGEVAYLLEIEHIGYEVRAEKRAEKHEVVGSIALRIEAEKRFHVKSNQQGTSIDAEGRLHKIEERSLALEIAYVMKSPSGRLEVQTRIGVNPNQPQEIGSIRGTRETSGKPHDFIEAVRITLREHEVAVRGVSSRAGTPPPRWIEPSPVDKGMMLDAIEHQRRIEKRLRDERQLPTTFDRGEFHPAPELRRLLQNPARN